MTKKQSRTLKEMKLDKKRLLYSRIISFFIVILLVFSVFGIMVQNTSENNNNISYKTYKFAYREGQTPYYEIIKSKEYKSFTGTKFYYLPNDMNLSEEIKNIASKFSDASFIYATIDPSSLEGNSEPSQSLKFQEFSRESLSQFLTKTNTYLFKGITKNSSLINQPIINCNNASKEIIVIKYAEGESNIKQITDNCFELNENNAYDFLRTTEKIKLGMLP